MHVGRSVRRFEDVRLLRGGGRYTDDVVFADQAYAAFVRSPHPHALVRGIRVDDARSLAGVLAVFTAADYLADGCVGISHAPVPADTVRHDVPAFGMFDGHPPFDAPHLPLASERVRYVGEAVAVVVAETQVIAHDAAALIEVEYDVLPAVLDARAALSPGAAVVWDARPDNVACAGEFGDLLATESALRLAEVVVEHEFRSQRIVNAQMEPRACIGSFSQDSNTYLMVAGSQGAIRQRATLAAALRVPLADVRVVCPDVGGGFGPRTSLYPEQVVVTWAARKVGRSVRWTSDRAEAFVSDFQGRDSVATARLGLDRDGRVRALYVDFILNIGGQTVSYVPMSNAARVLTSVYDVPAAYVRVRGVLTHTLPTGPYRGAGRPEAMFIVERLLDLAADRLAIDRVELRRRNLIRRECLPYRTAVGLTYDSGDFLANMNAALALADWHGFSGRRELARSRGHLAGIGVANYVESPVGAPHECVRLSRSADGSIEVRVGTQSSGQGHETAFAQIVADQLGVAPSAIRIVTGDTDLVAAGGGTHSDRSLRLVSTLLVEACAKLRAGTDVADAAFTGRLPAYPTGCAVCEVEIDPETGALQVTRYTSVDDVGQPINPLIVHGQVHGGIVQGLGQALSERADAAAGTFLDYALPTAANLPWFTSELVEDPTTGNPLRIKGGGESGITPCLAAVVNAALDALAPLGVRDLHMPLTAARLWQAMRA